jgi:hypothetical protein
VAAHTLISDHSRYKSNKAELVNSGLKRMLTDHSNNDELQRYMDEKAYDTASLGETSADELVLPSSDSAEIDFYRDSDIGKGY